MELVVLLLMYGQVSLAQEIILDDFETPEGWQVITSEDVDLTLASDHGHTGAALRLDFDFKGGGGYVIVRKPVSLALPDNYEYTFYLRGEAPRNNFEYKLVDPSSQNVWWVNRRNFSFPHDWQPVTIKKHHLDFAWGPQGGGDMQAVAAIEIAITAGSGGQGSVWLDELVLETRESLQHSNFTAKLSASSESEGHTPERVLDGDEATDWRSDIGAEQQWLKLDFTRLSAYGGLVIDWDHQDYATHYGVYGSDDSEVWRLLKTVEEGNGGRDWLYLPDTESRYLKLELMKSARSRGYGIQSIAVKPIEFSRTVTAFFEALAADNPKGFYPKYLTGEQSYWTVVGAPGDVAEGLLNEEGMLEVDMASFSIEPFLSVDGKLMTWADVKTEQGLEHGYLPVPTVTWTHPEFVFKITAWAAGKPGQSALFARYHIENTATQPHRVKLFLAVRPFQVNPPWQTFNLPGGPSPVHELRSEGNAVWVNEHKAVVSLTPADAFGAATFDQGGITDYLRASEIPTCTSASDPFGYASGALSYTLELMPGEAQEVFIAVPFHTLAPEVAALTQQAARVLLADTIQGWTQALEQVEVKLPAASQNLADMLKTTLAYILINMDGPAIQPGSRGYERSWIRDGALTSAAMLRLGRTSEVRDFIRWFAGYQLANGKVPCCVDARGADPIPEHDSHGQFIYLVMEYYRYTQDLSLLKEMWPHVVKAVEYIEGLRRQRLTEVYQATENRAFYGLVPQSISHEGYAANPVHAYWDDFFILRGLKDAVSMAESLGEVEHVAHFVELRDAFRQDLYVSLEHTMARHDIDYIPGAVELGDFDAPAVTVAVTPGGELSNLPQAALRQTFDQYYEYFRKRRDGELAWSNYAPYELRVVGTFIRLGQKDRAHELLDYILADRRPAAWNQWAEIIWRDPKAPRYIGDMPHTWIGSDFIRSVLSLFAYEREADDALVLAAGIPGSWLTQQDTGVTIQRLPTYYGTLNYTLKQNTDGHIRLTLSGDIKVPRGKIVVESPLATPLLGVTVNDQPVQTFTSHYAVIDQFPAEVELRYSELDLAHHAADVAEVAQMAGAEKPD